MTLEYPPGVPGLIRCLTDPAQSPGNVEWSCAVFENGTDVDIKIFCGRRAPSQEEIDELTDYYTARGFFAGIWDRFKNGKKPRRVILRRGDSK